MSDLPPLPPGAVLDPEPTKPKKSKRRDALPPLPAGAVLDDPEAIDGDTIKSDQARVRLWGADAPELAQRGWDREGNAVPIGQQSRDFLQGEVNNAGSVNLDSVEGMSYGRLVGPVTLDGNDAALSSIRTGNALAAPTFVHGDPDYRFKLIEAERLARLNQLGPMNDTYHQTPAEHRADPEWKPERETIPQFFDTPTPLQGMKPEAEKQYLALQANGSADQIVKFAKAQGLDMDPAKVAEWVAWRDKQKAGGKPFQNYANYQRGPEVMQQVGDGAFRAGGRAYSQGFLAGGLDEGGAIFDTLLPNIPGLMTNGPRENIYNSDRRVADIFANNLDQNAAILRGDDYAHPNATTGGEVAGALTSGVVIPYGQGARTAAELARVGAVYGAASGFLGTDGGLAERAKGAVIGAPVGAVLNAGIGKAIEYGAPVVGRGVQRLLGRDGTKPAEAAGEVAGEYVNDNALNAAEALPDANAGDLPPLPRGARPDAVGESGNVGRGVARGHDPALNSDATPNPVSWEEFQRDGSDRFLIYHGPEGQQANVHVSIGDDGVADISIDPFSKDANRFGPGIVRQAARDLKQLYPEIRAFRGERESGANPGRVQSMAMDAEPASSISAEPRQRDYINLSAPARARPLLDPATDAERMAAAERVQPRDVLPIASNEVDGPEELAAAQAGRFVEARVPDERSHLSRGTVRNWMGKEVPKVGPTDMVGWLRLRGGLQDQGGELSHMGLTNAARRGLDHVGQEARFGPLVNNDTGQTLDDAALAAWEAGFFPERTERPSVNDFLDALHDTYNGGANRRFLPDDYAELERYSATQAERYDLEQRQNEVGGPVYDDRSVPADDAAPFAPPEAFEDWGSSAPDFAGNIRLEKLDTPQDIKRALVQTERQTGFDAATRGKITQAETERLAADLNMTPQQLLARRQGQALNAEQALAARQILAKSANELVNAAKRIRELGEDPGAEALAEFRQKWMRHAAIQEQVAGATAEAGRTLAQFRMAANSRAVRADVLSAFVKGGGGTDRLQDAANALLDAVEESPGKFNALSEKLTRPKWRDKISEFYINMLLTNPPTHIVNMVSNTLTAIGSIPEYALASAIGGARSVVARKAVNDRILASEVGARTFGLIQGTREGFALFGKALRTGEADDLVSKIEGQQYEAIGGKIGKFVRTPTRLLTAEDQLFKGIARRMAINGLAVRKASREGLQGEALSNRVAGLMANPTDDILHAAMDEGLYRTFQSPLGEFGRGLSQMANSNLPTKVVIPFVRTPINLMKYAVERSPAAPLLKEWKADFAAGGERRDLAVAKWLLGSGFMTSIYAAANSGVITGAMPPDPKKAKLLYADGWQPYSIKVGDRYISYSRLDPLATTIGVAADMATLPSGMSDRQRSDMAVMLVASVMGNLASKTWLSGASAFTEALSDPGRYADNWLQRTVGSFAVPAGVAGAARAIDPTARKRDSIGDAIQARVPGLSDDLLPQRDVFGEPVVGDSLGPDFLSPFWTSKSKHDPVVAEMLRIDAGVSAPGKQYTDDGERVDYTPEEYDRYHELAGRFTYNGLLGLMGSDEYRGLDDNGRRKAVKKAITAARKSAREVLHDPDFPLPPRGSGGPVPVSTVPASPKPGGSVPPLPPGAVIDGESMGRNVYRELQEKIPGIQFTSGFRDYDYNQSLKRRGYHAADDSTHMDGDTFDALPPAGRSMDWLRAQVKRAYPKAETLIHDGHLHFRIPGYYGAPAIGGAATAGVRNPLAGMPPPPPGATLDAF